MKFHTFYILSLILFLLGATFTACNNSQVEKGVLSIDVNKQITKSLDDYISHIEIIPLETTDEALLQNYWKVIEHNDKIFILDRSSGLYVFDNNGKYLSKIGNLGNGPGEYIYIADFQINPFTENIEILEPLGKVKVYSIDGEYLYHYGERYQEVSYFYIIDEDLVLFSHNSFSPALNLYSRKANSVITSFFTLDRDFLIFRPLMTDAHYYVFNNELYIHYGYMNEIYRFDNNELIPVLQLDFGEHNFRIDDYSWEYAESDMEILSDFTDRKYVYGFRQDFETRRYLLKQFCYRYDILLLIYDKLKNEYEILCELEDCIRYMLTDVRHYSDYLSNILPKAEETGTRLPELLNWDSGKEYALGCINSQTRARYINPKILDEDNLKRYNNISLNNNPALVKIYFND